MEGKEMNHNFRPNSCPEAVYDLLNVDGSLELKVIYMVLDNFAHSSIRRSLYNLKDQDIVEKTKDDKWKIV